MSAESGPASRGSRRTRTVCRLLLLGALGAVALLQRVIDRYQSTNLAFAEVLYMPSGQTIHRLSLGYEGLLADVYWTRAVQYFGSKKIAGSARLDLLGPLLRITTTLDPHLLIAYRFGAVFLAERAPGGAGQPEEALDLLRRGITANPGYWRLWQDVGFIYYWDLQDYRAAARAFRAGSERPGAMPWMKVLAATVLAKGGDLSTSRLLWSQIYEHAENGDLQRSAFEHLQALRAKEDIAALELLVRQFRQRYGQNPVSLKQLVDAGFLKALPRDPSGAPYAMGAGGTVVRGPGSRVDLRLLL